MEAELEELEERFFESNKRGTQLAQQRDHIADQLILREEEVASLQRRIQATAELEKQLHLSKREIDQLKQQSDLQTIAFSDQRDELLKLRDASAELEAANKQLDLTHQRLVQANQLSDQLKQKVDQHDELISKTNTRLSLANESVKDLERQLTTKSKQHDELAQQVEQLTDDQQANQELIANLESKLTSMNSLEAESDLLRSKNTDLVGHLRRIGNAHEESLQENERAQESIANLQQEIHQHLQTIRMLRRQRGTYPAIDDEYDAA